jgi:small-conductance mechanosensitive channel
LRQEEAQEAAEAARTAISFFEPLLEELNSIWIGFVQSIPQIVLSILLVLVTWLVAALVSRGVHKAALRAHARRALADLFQTLSSIAIWIVGLLIAAMVLFPSVTPAQAISALGIGGIAVGLAFRDTFENFLAGIFILARQPMRKGDHIEVNDVSGDIEEVTIRDTYIRQKSNELVIVPNSILFKNPVEVETDRPQRRYDIVVGVAYGEDARAALDVIKQAAEGADEIDKDKGVEVYAREFNSSSLDFTVRWWAGSAPVDKHKSRSAVVLAIKDGLDSAGIEIPFPYRTLTFKEGLSIESRTGERDEEGGED